MKNLQGKNPQLDLKSVSDIDSIKLTTLSLSNELADLRRSMTQMQSHVGDKDAEIYRLQLRLNEERKGYES